MDTGRFASELPRLFDDFPRSARPRGRRFDDLVREVPNLAMENNFALINLAASLLGPGESYVEAGTYMGASLIAAARDNDGVELIGIDDFSIGPVQEIDRTLPPADRAALEHHLERFGVEASILEGDAVEVLGSDGLGGRSVGLFYYDACHDYDAQLEALQLVEPYLAGPSLVIVDDSEWERVRDSVRDYLAGQPRAELVLEIPGRRAGYPQWWHGMTIVSYS